MTEADPLAPHGWRSSFPEFEKAPARVVRARLQDFLPDASPQQVRAWDDSIPKLQTEVREVIEGESDAGRYTAILEYELPLDAVLLAWGTDLVRENGSWSTAGARGYKRGTKVKNPFQLRLNAYRVLLTRGRDGTVVFVPPLEQLDETATYLASFGFHGLAADGS